MVSTVELVFPGALLFLVSGSFLVFWLPSCHRILDNFLKVKQLKKMVM
jgi:hypothetical protein